MTPRLLWNDVQLSHLADLVESMMIAFIPPGNPNTRVRAMLPWRVVIMNSVVDSSPTVPVGRPSPELPVLV